MIDNSLYQIERERAGLPFDGPSLRDVILCKPDAGPSDKNPRFQAVAKGVTLYGSWELD